MTLTKGTDMKDPVKMKWGTKKPQYEICCVHTVKIHAYI